jgi:MerR family transcriptional regulator, mercuric resistance operon regulatory protein
VGRVGCRYRYATKGLDLVRGYRVHSCPMRTAEVADLAAVNRQTLRYYERRGLLAAPDRTRAGYRSYPADAVQRVRFIKRAQSVGFSLDEVATLLHLNDGSPDDCPTAHSLVMEKVAELDAQVADLQSMRATLLRLAARCGDPTVSDCPILDEFDATEDQ